MSHILNAFRSFMQQGGGGLLLPEMMLVLFAMGILLTDYLLEARDKYFNALMAMLGVIFSLLTLVGLPKFLTNFLQRIPFLRGFELPGLRAVADRGAIAFSSSLLVDPFFLFFGFLFLIATAIVILLSVRYLQIEDENHGEYYALILFATVGMMFMASGYDLIVEFLGLETMALSFYVLAGFLRRDKRSNEGAVKYLLLGAFSSAILAYGFSILYGIGATANLSPFGGSLPPRTNLDVIQAAVDARGHGDLLVVLALVTVISGLFFKVAAVPFHQWAPDVYEGAPTPITAYISVASKTASFALLLRSAAYRFLACAPRLGNAGCRSGRRVFDHRKFCRHHANEYQAHAGVFLDLACRLHSAGNRGGRLQRARFHDRDDGRCVLPLRIRVHDHRRLRRSHRIAAAGNR